MLKRDLKIEIAAILADGKSHSGEELGKQFNVSRTAISNHIKRLTELGLDIFSVHGKGYRIAESLALLNKDKINDSLIKPVPLEVFPIIDSTNSYLMSQVRQQQIVNNGHTVIAECQTAGRGRRGRVWVSPFGSHLYFSQYRRIEDGLAAAAGLSLAVGLAVKFACDEVSGSQLALKWPNDLLSDGKKVAGILVEAEGQSDGVCHIIIGVGINVDMPQQLAKEIDQPWNDLNTIAGAVIDRNELAAALCKHLQIIMEEYQLNKLDNLYHQWNQYNAFQNQLVTITSNKTEQIGRCIGIDRTGALVLEDPESSVRSKVYGGEVSLRKLQS